MIMEYWVPEYLSVQTVHSENNMLKVYKEFLDSQTPNVPIHSGDLFSEEIVPKTLDTGRTVFAKLTHEMLLQELAFLHV